MKITTSETTSRAELQRRLDILGSYPRDIQGSFGARDIALTALVAVSVPWLLWHLLR